MPRGSRQRYWALTPEEQRDHQLQKKRAWARENRRKQPEKFREIDEKRKPQKQIYQKAYLQRKKTKHQFVWKAKWAGGGLNAITASQLARLYHSQRGLCALTGRKLSKTDLQLDHVEHRSTGGTDLIENLRWVCKDANTARCDLSDSELYQLAKDIVRTLQPWHEPGAEPWR